MPKKRVLIITNFIGMSPFVGSLTKHLADRSIQVDVIDTGKWHFYRNNVIEKNRPFYANAFRIPVIGYFLMLSHLSVLIRRNKNYDAVDILYLQPYVRRFGEYLSKHNKRLMVSYAGSDFYRVPDIIKQKVTALLDKCSAITFGNYQMADEFNKYYNNKYKTKLFTADFGIDIIPILDKNNNTTSKAVFRKNNNINDGDIIITIGYNGHDEQQHIKIIEKLKQIRRDNLFLLILFTYGGTQEYMNRVKEVLESNNFRYKMFTKYLPDRDIADIRLNSDIVINMQLSDQASSSLLEHLYCGNIVLVGEWLPYKFWDDMGVYYHKINENNIADKLAKVIEHFKEEKAKCENNHISIGKVFSWEKQIELWLHAFKFDDAV